MGELTLDVDQHALGVVDQDQRLRAQSGELTAELRADRAPRTRDENRLAGHVGGDRADIELDRFASENVLDLDLAQLPC